MTATWLSRCHGDGGRKQDCWLFLQSSEGHLLTKRQALKIIILERTTTNNDVVVLVHGKKCTLTLGTSRNVLLPNTPWPSVQQ